MSTRSKSTGALELFCSYSTEDEDYRRSFERALAEMRRVGILATWNFRKITPGENLDTQIDMALKRADIIVLLVSSAFLDSDYSWNVEMRTAVERHDRGEAWIVPVIVRSCLWADAPFARLNALPQDGKPVSSWANQDEAWTDVARGIRAVVDEIKRGRHGETILQSSEPPRTTSAKPATTSGTKRTKPSHGVRRRTPSEIVDIVLTRSPAGAKVVGAPLLLYENSFQRTWLVFLTGEVICLLEDITKGKRYNPIRWRAPNAEVLPLQIRPYKLHTGLIDFGESHVDWLYSIELHPDSSLLVKEIEAALAE